MKKGKELIIKLPYSYKVKTGTIDNKNPESIYIQISAWGQLKDSDGSDFNKKIKQKHKKIKKKLHEILDTEQFLPNVIVDFNMASSGICFTKRSFMSLEVTLFQKKLLPINSEILLSKINEMSQKIIEDVFEKDEDFVFYKTKK